MYYYVTVKNIYILIFYYDAISRYYALDDYMKRMPEQLPMVRNSVSSIAGISRAMSIKVMISYNNLMVYSSTNNSNTYMN